MLRRLATWDTLLIVLACAVIVLALYPAGVARQTFQVRQDDGTWQSFSLPLGDPALKQLKQRFDQSVRSPSSVKLAVAKWTRELAEFYAAQCAADRESTDQLAATGQAAGSVVTVSYDTRAAATDSKLGPASRAYWVGVQAKMRTAIETIKLAISEREKLPPPVIFGEIVPARLSLLGSVAAVFAGLMVAVLYAVWRNLSQPIGFPSNGDCIRLKIASGTFGPADSPGSIISGHVEIPPAWIRIRQPRAVLIRRLSLLLLVSVAVAQVID